MDAEYQPFVEVGCLQVRDPVAEDQLLAGLADALLGQLGGDEHWERHGAAVVGLRSADDDLAIHAHGVLRDRQTPSEHVEVADAQGGRLTPPEARVSEEAHECAVWAGLRSEEFYLAVCEIAVRLANLARQIDVARRISGEEPIFDRYFDDRGEDRVCADNARSTERSTIGFRRGGRTSA